MSTFSPTVEAIQNAARVIREGGMVVMPTETVYGLACNALDAEAVLRVFEVKGRPAENPLIVHLARFEQLGTVAASWPPIAEKLAHQYWPGPLTLVLPKRPELPTETTGGLDTVAVRIPQHPVAREIIERAGVPVAAPSANVFMGLSPTNVRDLDPEILVEVDIVIDGGDCEVGLESTVLDLSDATPRILRPGAISRADIQARIGQPLGMTPPIGVRAPGMYRRHYAPTTPLVLAHEVKDDEAGLVFGEPENPRQIKMPREAKAYAVLMYGALRRLDMMKVGRIVVQEPPALPEWEAVLDRLRKASASLA